jgi:hypothetical protein
MFLRKKERIVAVSLSEKGAAVDLKDNGQDGASPFLKKHHGTFPPLEEGDQQHPFASHVCCVDPSTPQSNLSGSAIDEQVGSEAAASDRVAKIDIDFIV